MAVIVLMRSNECRVRSASFMLKEGYVRPYSNA